MNYSCFLAETLMCSDGDSAEFEVIYLTIHYEIGTIQIKGLLIFELLLNGLPITPIKSI
jgi:hypothetical protein